LVVVSAVLTVGNWAGLTVARWGFATVERSDTCSAEQKVLLQAAYLAVQRVGDLVDQWVALMAVLTVAMWDDLSAVWTVGWTVDYSVWQKAELWGT
jgi:hypothetical protein